MYIKATWRRTGLLQNIASRPLLLLSVSGGDDSDGDAGDGFGGGAAGRQGGRLLVTAGCGNGGAAGLAVSFIILSLKEHKNMYNCKLQYSEITQVRMSLCCDEFFYGSGPMYVFS
jgi:hypothetical protein